MYVLNESVIDLNENAAFYWKKAYHVAAVKTL